MKNSILKLTSIILIIFLALSIMPTAVRAADSTEGVMLEKTNGEKVIYIKNMDNTEFKYAFSNNDDATTAPSAVWAILNAQDGALNSLN